MCKSKTSFPIKKVNHGRGTDSNNTECTAAEKTTNQKCFLHQQPIVCLKNSQAFFLCHFNVALRRIIDYYLSVRWQAHRGCCKPEGPSGEP